jgi:ribosomal protein S18 acetylase RimI-like enzyme
MIHKVTNTIDIEITAQLAHKIWNDHYVPIIGQKQVDYMLDKFQSFNAISNQIKNGYEYFLIFKDEKPIGYLCLIIDNPSKKLMISKIYTEKDVRGFGFGMKLIEFTKKIAQEKEMKTIWLTVNKYNSNSIKWYQKLNFEIVKEVKMNIGNNYIMDDFVLELKLD